jgi:hypothetical protein
MVWNDFAVPQKVHVKDVTRAASAPVKLYDVTLKLSQIMQYKSHTASRFFLDSIIARAFLQKGVLASLLLDLIVCLSRKHWPSLCVKAEKVYAPKQFP